MIDVLIIGGGPAGMNAGIYAKRGGLSVLILEKGVCGGQVAETSKVDNYLGFASIDGYDLAITMKKHILSQGIEIKQEEVVSAELNGDIKTIKTNKNTYQAKVVIIATGAFAKALDVEGEKKYIGKGVSYCATCDGNFFKGKDVAIVGGGNSGLKDALYLAGIANKVYLIHRRDEFRGDKCFVEQIYNSKNIQLVLNSVVTNIVGDNVVEGLAVKNIITDEVKKLDVSALFVAVGRKPDTEIFAEQINLDKNGYIIAGEDTKTNIAGVYACGDVRTKFLRQIATAISDGAVAGNDAIIYIKSKR